MFKCLQNVSLLLYLHGALCVQNIDLLQSQHITVLEIVN